MYSSTLISYTSTADFPADLTPDFDFCAHLETEAAADATMTEPDAWRLLARWFDDDDPEFTTNWSMRTISTALHYESRIPSGALVDRMVDRLQAHLATRWAIEATWWQRVRDRYWFDTLHVESKFEPIFDMRRHDLTLAEARRALCLVCEWLACEAEDEPEVTP